MGIVQDVHHITHLSGLAFTLDQNVKGATWFFVGSLTPCKLDN